MIIFQNKGLTLNDLYEYDKTSLAYPSTFKPSLTEEGVYDIIVTEGKQLPVYNKLPRKFRMESGIRAGNAYEMALDYVRGGDAGEVLEIIITNEGSPVVDVEIKTYYAGTNQIILPVYYTDLDGRAELFLPQGVYDFYLHTFIEQEIEPDPMGRICGYDSIKEFSRSIKTVEVPEGIREYDVLESENRVPIVRYLRRTNSGSPCRQGNLLQKVRYDRYSDFEPNIFNGGFTRVYDENGKLVQVSEIDEHGRSITQLEKGKQYVMYHDKEGFETVAELLDTSYLLKGRISAEPIMPEVYALPDGAVGFTIKILSKNTNRGNISFKFTYVDTADQNISDFHLKLYSMENLLDPMFEIDVPFYVASQLQTPSNVSGVFVGSNIAYTPNDLDSGSVVSGLKKNWFMYELQDMDLMNGSYQLHLRVKNDDGLWSDWGIEEFSIEE